MSRALAALREPDHFDVLPAVPAFGTWTHSHGAVTVIRPKGSPCGETSPPDYDDAGGSCGATEETQHG